MSNYPNYGPPPPMNVGPPYAPYPPPSTQYPIPPGQSPPGLQAPAPYPPYQTTAPLPLPYPPSAYPNYPPSVPPPGPFYVPYPPPLPPVGYPPQIPPPNANYMPSAPPMIPPYPPVAYPPQMPTNIPPAQMPFPGGAGGYPMGRKKSLLIGINYTGTAAELRGCVADVARVRKFITSVFGFPETPDSMVILTDDQRDRNKLPTKTNIISACRWLVEGARPGDSLFLHFSGHGGQAVDTDGDEVDGYDETILPLDYKTAGQIVDDDLNIILVKPLPPGVKLTVLFDSCHSGTALDLPYIYNVNGQIERPMEPGSGHVGGADILGMGISLLLGGNVKFPRRNRVHRAQIKTEMTKGSAADVVMFSSCRDDQTSADASISGIGSTGAMSFAFIEVLSKNKVLTYRELLSRVREILRTRFSQVPQLSSSHPMDMSQYFLM